MAGTVLADTNVFARTFDQQQWEHAFGLQLIPARAAEAAAGRVHGARVVVRDASRRPTTTTRSSRATCELLMDGLQLAGPKLTPAELPGRPVPRTAARPGPTLDRRSSTRSATTASGRAPTTAASTTPASSAGTRTRSARTRPATSATGMYRLVDGGQPLPPGQWPTDAGEAVRPGRHGHDLRRRRHPARPHAEDGAGAARRAGRQEITISQAPVAEYSGFTGDRYPTVPR